MTAWSPLPGISIRHFSLPSPPHQPPSYTVPSPELPLWDPPPPRPDPPYDPLLHSQQTILPQSLRRRVHEAELRHAKEWQERCARSQELYEEKLAVTGRYLKRSDLVALLRRLAGINPSELSGRDRPDSDYRGGGGAGWRVCGTQELWENAIRVLEEDR